MPPPPDLFLNRAPQPQPPVAPAFRGPEAVPARPQTTVGAPGYEQRPPSKHKLQERFKQPLDLGSEAGGRAATANPANAAQMRMGMRVGGGAGPWDGGQLGRPRSVSASSQSGSGAMERTKPAYEAQKFSQTTGSIAETSLGASQWGWCTRSNGVQKPIGIVQDVPVPAHFLYKTWSAPDMSYGPSMIRGKKAEEPFFGTERQFGLRDFDGKMSGGPKAREGWAGTQSIYGRGWRHQIGFKR